MLKVPISGGPHAGKTTTLEALKLEFPEAYFVAEPAEVVISRELAKQVEDPTYEPVVPWVDYKKFCPIVTEESLRLEAEIPDNATLVFQDRSLIDNIGYCRLNGFDTFIPTVERYIAAARYTLALFCEPVGTYTATHVRRETVEEARLTHDHLSQAYDGSGVQMVHLPAVTLEERLTIIRNTIETMS
ncbi:MAG TPA: ATP-binding protein [Candidatus Saccharimonadales bacterium]|nr:ATP-binding protein [Candidatus Saccharimonadales bacterium]